MTDNDWLLQLVAATCERLGIKYLTVGSVATSMYGDPRFTNDIDVLMDLQRPQLRDFCEPFSSTDFYLSRPAVEAAVLKRTQFNIIHTLSSLKVDCMLTDNSPFCRSQLSRGFKQRTSGDVDVMFAAPEDVILKKMEYYQLGGSDKHLRDITGVLTQCPIPIDRDYIERWAKQLRLTDIWRAIITRVDAEPPASP